MDFKPMTDKEIAEDGLIPAGTRCVAEVVSSDVHIGKESGKESTKVTFAVYNGDKRKELTVYLTPACKTLWKHAIVSMLGEAVYNTGKVTPDMFLGKICDVLVEHETYNNSLKNVIKDIFVATNTVPKADLPF